MNMNILYYHYPIVYETCNVYCMLLYCINEIYTCPFAYHVFNYLYHNSKSLKSETCRKRHMGRRKRANILQQSRSIIRDNVLPFINDTTRNSPHCLLELSRREWLRHKDNAIHLSGLYTIENGRNIKKYFRIVNAGCNVKLKKTHKSLNENGIGNYFYQEINIDQMKGGYIMIIMDKIELEREKDLIILDTTRRSNANDNNDNNYHPSGKVILMVTTLSHQYGNHGYIWGKDEYMSVNKVKSNTIKNENQHFGSEGKVYSFGNRGNFGMINDSSVTQYAIKSKTPNGYFCAAAIENMAAEEICLGINDLENILPTIRGLIAPILDVCYDYQSEIGNINLKKVPTSDDGLWQTSVCVNSFTKKFHTEHDCSYTFIYVPQQEINQKRYTDAHYTFLFSLNIGNNVGIRLKSGISIMYSGVYLTHRQSCENMKTKKKTLFFNIASYGNQMLFQHVRRSFDRKKESIANDLKKNS